MSYLEKLKKNLNNQDNKKQKKDECKPGWIILNKETLIENMRKKKEEENIEKNQPIVKNEDIPLCNYEYDYKEEFYIKYGCDILDFYVDMEDYFRDCSYNILNKHKFGSCYSYDLDQFVMKNTNMITNEDLDSNSFDSGEEENDFH